MTTFKDAEKLAEILVKQTSWKDLQDNADKPYKKWLDEKRHTLMDFEKYKTQVSRDGPAR